MVFSLYLVHFFTEPIFEVLVYTQQKKDGNSVLVFMVKRACVYAAFVAWLLMSHKSSTSHSPSHLSMWRWLFLYVA